MVSLRHFHRRFLNKRQDLRIFGNLFRPRSGSSPIASDQESSTSSGSSDDANPLDPGGMIIGSSLLGNDPTTSSGPSSGTTASTPLTNPSSSSTGSTATPATTSSTHTSTSASISPTTHTSTNTLATSATLIPATTPTSTPSTSPVIITSSDGTSIVYITSTPPTASATGGPPSSFLHNPPLETGVFTVVGIIALVFVVTIITWTIRKRHRDRLERDAAVAVTFDPIVTDRYEQREGTMEKRRLSASSSGHGHGYGYGVQPAYAAPQEYPGPAGYGQYPMTTYSTAFPQTPYQAPTIPQPTAQGGANLTRKYSDRKPVPPLLPTPAYDPANAHVSIPPQFYPQ